MKQRNRGLRLPYSRGIPAARRELRLQDEWQNMFYGGDLRWQLACRYGIADRELSRLRAMQAAKR